MRNFAQLPTTHPFIAPHHTSFPHLPLSRSQISFVSSFFSSIISLTSPKNRIQSQKNNKKKNKMQNSFTDFEDSPSEATRKMVRDFEAHLRLSEQEPESYEEDEEVDEEEEEEEEEEFSFSLDSFNFSTISADDAFSNGQIKPAAFPLFNQALILPEGEDLESLRSKDRLPKVNRVFIPAGDVRETMSSKEDESISGPYCEWSNNKVVEAASAAAPDTCKKSNSTGFSKIWRFKEFMHRSNSDGRDAFVFLNQNHHGATTSSSGKKEEKEKVVAAAPAAEVKKVRKTNKKVALSAHEVYLRSKAKDTERRRSYLPYRPDLVGLFTNVNGGALTRNVHPF